MTYELSTNPAHVSVNRRTGERSPITPITHVGLEVEVGGTEGGNCWDGDPSSYYTSERVDADDLFLGLDVLGLVNLDALSIKAYINLKKGLLAYKRHVAEYYGNGTNYECFVVPVKIEDGKLNLEAA